MSLTRLPLRSTAAALRTCTRPFSTSTPTQDILSILGSSSASRNHPSTPQPQPRATASDTSLSKAARSLGLTNSSHRQALQESTERASFQKHIYRRWASGDVYSPHDLTPAEQKKWKAYRKAPSSDAFDTLGLNPINEYKNFTIMSEYMSEMGRIKHSKETGLRPKNQRKVAKAIRRAIGLGLMPSVHRHPLVLKKGGAGRFFQ